MSYVLIVWVIAALLVSIKRHLEEIEIYDQMIKHNKIEEEKPEMETYYDDIEKQFEFSTIELDIYDDSP